MMIRKIGIIGAMEEEVEALRERVYGLRGGFSCIRCFLANGDML